MTRIQTDLNGYSNLRIRENPLNLFHLRAILAIGSLSEQS
jgi:hypothetical protein